MRMTTIMAKHENTNDSAKNKSTKNVSRKHNDLNVSYDTAKTVAIGQ